MHTLVPYIVVVPVVGFLLNGLFGKKLGSERLSGLIGSGAVGVSFIIALSIFIEMLKSPATERSHIVTLFTWMTAGSFSVNVAYQVDQLSVLMTMIVTGVGFLIHVY